MRRRFALSGGMPDPSDPPPGCVFSTRCPYAIDLCTAEKPALRPPAGGGLVACHRADEIALRGVG